MEFRFKHIKNDVYVTCDVLCGVIFLSFSEECFYRLEAEDVEKMFQSPGYPSGNDPNSRCQWQIRASEENTITVNFLDFNIKDDCANDFVSIFDSLSPDYSQAITK